MPPFVESRDTLLLVDIPARRYGLQPSKLLGIEDETNALIIDIITALVGQEEERKVYNVQPTGDGSFENPSSNGVVPAGINPTDLDYFLDPKAKPRMGEWNAFVMRKRKAEVSKKG